MANLNIAIASAFRLESSLEQNEVDHRELYAAICEAGLFSIRIRASFTFDGRDYEEKGFFCAGKESGRRGGSGQVLGLRKAVFRLRQKALMIRFAGENAFVHTANGETIDLGEISSDNLAKLYIQTRGFEHAGLYKDIEFCQAPTFFNRIRRTYSASDLYKGCIRPDKNDEAA